MTIGHYLMIEGILGLLALVALVVWLATRPARRARRVRERAADIDYRIGGGAIDHDELEAAEREVRDAGGDAEADGEGPDDDWGPGTYRGP